MTNSMRLHLRAQSGIHRENQWTFDNAEEITAGFLPANSVYLMDAAAGPSRVLFRRKGGELCLRIAEDIRGELTIDGKPVSLASLASLGLVRSDRKGPYVLIGEKTTGSLSIGATRLEFWLTPAPKEAESSQPPLFIRWKRQIVQSFALALVISVFLHLAVGVTIKRLPAPPPLTWEDMDRRIARLIVPNDVLSPKPPEPEPEVSQYTAPKDQVKPPPAQTPPPAAGFLAAVTRSKPGAKASPFEKLFSTNSLGGDLNQALKTQTLDSLIAKQVKGLGTVDTATAPKTVEIGVPKSAVAPSAQIQREASAPALSRMSIDTPEVEGTMNRDALAQVVNQNAGQLRDCYEQALSRKPNLSGKVVIQLTVSPLGLPTGVGIEESSLADASVERCIISKINAWVFPKPSGGSTPVKFPFIFTASSRG